MRLFYLFILTFRPSKTAHAYKKIWRKESNESPLLYFTRSQAYKLNKKIAHESVTAVDEGLSENSFGSLSIDDEGLEPEKSVLIENGILTSNDIKKEISTDLKFTRDKIINKLDLVSREEFEVLKKIVQKQEEIIKKLKQNTKFKKVKKS